MARAEKLPRRFASGAAGSRELVIGLVNNMPDSALRTTEWQVRGLLARAAVKATVRLRLFSLPGLWRGEAGKAHVAKFHEPIDALYEGPAIAGLIITGTEPKAARLTDEPYWPALADLIDWSAENTVSTIFSCLASHAAILHLDGIDRRPLQRKISGIFPCYTTCKHPLVQGLAGWTVPHSRRNDLAEDLLVQAGYHILSRSPDVGVDLFVREGPSLFVFFQGHPEYDAGSLFGEYRRDVRRFLSGAAERYPEIPHGCFSEGARALLVRFREHAVEQRDVKLLDAFPVAPVAAELRAPWRDAASQIYRNWLGLLREKLSEGVARARIAALYSAAAAGRARA